MENHNFENEGQFKRKMTSRHLFMLSLGGVIGTGLFLSSGYTIAQAGPLGAVISYLVGAIVVYLVMLSLGELAVAMPVTGSFHTYATKFISPGTGFTIAWLYWICWTVALGTEFLGAGMLMGRWIPYVPTWVFAALFALLIFGLNALSVRSFAEAESFFSSIKVLAILVFIILGFGAMFGLVSFNGKHEAFLFSHLTAHGALPKGLPALISVMLAVNYAFSGTELIGIAAGETNNPKEAVPKAIKTTIGRLVIFFVLTIVVLASLLPMKEAGVSSAPFVDVFDKMGIPFAADIMNFVILTAILSAGNSGLYASSRMLWSLANEGMISQKVVKINEHGVPMRALLLSMAGAVLALFSSIYAADTVYLALVSIAGFAVVVVWLSIPMAQINFRKEWLKSHTEEDLSYKTPFTPVLPYITIVLLLISIIGIAWDASQRAGLYFGIPFILLCYLYYYWRHKTL
ncbi:amino acid permease [Streptococcus troglodytae]|uniref:Amino acid permease n=1 Tax=Streptococcus troglodytae TaxID=1111760 RepID=A0A1L7LJL4_9STRE|nr:amino acid permease [Streptococcus troglodytae]BAQ24405.1 amino acid permease [Streptococcus troglodytae]